MGVLKRSIWIALVVWLTGCSSATVVRLSDQWPDGPRNPKRVEVYFQNPPRKSRPIALIAVARDGENAVWAVERLKEEAAAMGADAVVQLKMHYSTGMFPSLRLQGLAVSYE